MVSTITVNNKYCKKQQKNLPVQSNRLAKKAKRLLIDREVFVSKVLAAITSCDDDVQRRSSQVPSAEQLRLAQELLTLQKTE